MGTVFPPVQYEDILRQSPASPHNIDMKKIVLSADESLIEQARLVARSRRTTLNLAFRELLQQYVAQAGAGATVDSLMHHLKHVRSAGPYSRDEMNER